MKHIFLVPGKPRDQEATPEAFPTINYLKFYRTII